MEIQEPEGKEKEARFPELEKVLPLVVLSL